MASFDPSFDYIELLGMTPSDVLSAGALRLRKAIVAKKKEWTGKEQNPLYQQEARSAKERLLQFERLLGEQDAFVAYVHYQEEARAEKRQQQEAAIGRLIATAATGTKVLTPRQQELLQAEVRSLKVPVSVLHDVLRIMGIKSGRANRPRPARPVVPRMSNAMDPAILMETHNWLKVLDKPSLYTLLDLPESAPPSRLVATAKLLYAKWSKALPKTSVCTAWEKATQACITYLKDEEGKGRYNRALFNLRIDQFLKRVDLVFAGPTFGKAEQVLLTRVGVEDFGLSERTVRECLIARATEVGVVIETPVKVNLTLEAQIQCRRCYAWNAVDIHSNCRRCGSSLYQMCGNPACCKPAPADAKVCQHCRLNLAKGKQFAGLLDLADTFLKQGNAKGAADASTLADHILSCTETARRLACAQRIRVLTTSLRWSVAHKCWSKALVILQELVVLAPCWRQSDVPSLETITDYVVAARKKLDSIPASTDPIDAIRICLTCLRHWTDCDEAYHRAHQLCRVLEQNHRYQEAWEAVCTLAEQRAADQDLALWAQTLKTQIDDQTGRQSQHESISAAIRNGHATRQPLVEVGASI